MEPWRDVHENEHEDVNVDSTVDERGGQGELDWEHWKRWVDVSGIEQEAVVHLFPPLMHQHLLLLDVWG